MRADVGSIHIAVLRRLRGVRHVTPLAGDRGVPQHHSLMAVHAGGANAAGRRLAVAHPRVRAVTVDAVPCRVRAGQQLVVLRIVIDEPAARGDRRGISTRMALAAHGSAVVHHDVGGVHRGHVGRTRSMTCFAFDARFFPRPVDARQSILVHATVLGGGLPPGGVAGPTVVGLGACLRRLVGCPACGIP